MLYFYPQPINEADAIGIFLLALFLAPVVIPPIIRKSKISMAEDIKNRYPDGFKRVMGPRDSISYYYAKEIVEKEDRIASAQEDYEVEQRKAVEEKRIREEARELRRKCPNATRGESDEYIVEHKFSIQKAEDRYCERREKAKTLLQLYPLGAREVCGYISPCNSLSDDSIQKLINNENAIRCRQKEIESNIEELKKLQPQFDVIRNKYPLAIPELCAENKWSTENAEHVKLLLSEPEVLLLIQWQRENSILLNSAKLDPILKEALSYVEQKGYDYGRERISQKYGERISNKVLDIIHSKREFEIISKHLDVIAKAQNDFARETRSLFPRHMSDWGWYNCFFEMEYQDEAHNEKKNTLTVFQAYCWGCCFDDSVSYEYYPSFKLNRTIKDQLEHDCRREEKIWDKVLSLLSDLKDKYENEVYVIFANTNHLDTPTINIYFEYLKGQLKKKEINFGDSAFADSVPASNKKYVVIDIITFDSELKSFCSSLFHNRHISQLGLHQNTTGVVYISILKCFDGAEVEKLNQKIIQENEEEKKKAMAEAAQKQQDETDIAEAKHIAAASPNGFRHYFPDTTIEVISASNARSVIQKKAAIRIFDETLSRLRDSVSGWGKVRWIPHYFFYYYYPKKFTDISAESQNVRNLIYDFKNGVSHIKVKDLVVDKIRNTFISADFAKICFVCIPASTRITNQARYKDFSRDVCQALGMDNAYEHITITKEKTQAHKGGTDSAEYSYDKFYFNGKFVILFDDIVTKGSSISAMKTDLESCGATIICAISIGRTYSDYMGNTPQPHPYTGKL